MLTEIKPDPARRSVTFSIAPAVVDRVDSLVERLNKKLVESPTNPLLDVKPYTRSSAVEKLLVLALNYMECRDDRQDAG